MVLGKTKTNSSKDNGMKQASAKPNPLPRTKVPSKVVSDYKSRSSIKQNNYSEKKQSSNYNSNNQNIRDTKYESTKETERQLKPKAYDYGPKEKNRSVELKLKPTNINNKSYEDKCDKSKGAVPKTSVINSKNKENTSNHLKDDVRNSHQSKYKEYKENTSNHPKEEIRNSRQSNVTIKTESRKSIYPSLNINEREYEEQNIKPEPITRNIDKKKYRPKSRSLLSLSNPNDSPKLSLCKHNDSDKELQTENRGSLSLEALLDSETKVPSNSLDKTELKAPRPRNPKLKSRENTKPELVSGVNSHPDESYERRAINRNPKTSGISSRNQRINSQNKFSSSSEPNSSYETNQPNMLEATSNSQLPTPRNNGSNTPVSQGKNNCNLNVSITNNYNQLPKSAAKSESKVHSNSKSPSSSNKGYLHIATIANITQKFGLGPMRKSQQIRNSKKEKYTQNTPVNRERERVLENQRNNNANYVNQNISSPHQARHIEENPRTQPQENRIPVPYRDYNISSISNPSSENNRTRNSSNNYRNRYPVLPLAWQTEDPRAHPPTDGTNQINNNARASGIVNQTSTPTTFTRNGYSSKKIKIPLKTLKNFRDAYEKVTKIIQEGKEHLLNGDYKQACSDFENGLKLMDCVLEVSVDNLQLPTLDATMCRSIQEVIFMDRKSALEGFSDAQAGILPPSDIEYPVPSGAPPSYTEVLRQDLLKTFAGKCNGNVSRKQENTQDILLDSNYDTNNTLLTAQNLENICVGQSHNISDPMSPSFSEPDNVDINIYTSHDVIFSRGGSLNGHSDNSNDINEICHVPLHRRNPSAPEFEDSNSITLTILPTLNTTEQRVNFSDPNSNENMGKKNSNLNTMVSENLIPSCNNNPKENVLHSESVNLINIDDEARNVNCNTETSSHETLTDIESCFTGSSTSVNSFDFHLTRTVSLPNSSLKYSVNKTFDFEEFNSYDAECSKVNEQNKSPKPSPQTNVKKHNAVSNATSLTFNSFSSSSGAANILLSERECNFEDASSPIKEQALNPLNNLGLLEFQNLPPPIPSITDLKIPKNLSPTKDSYSPPDVCKTIQITRKGEENIPQKDFIILKNSDAKVNEMITGKKRPPVPAPRRRFLLSKEASTRNGSVGQTKLYGSLTQEEFGKKQFIKPLTIENREYKEVFTRQQLSIYSKQNSQENCKKVENIYANIEEMQNLLKEKQRENEQPKYTFSTNNLTEGLYNSKSSALKNENIAISTSFVKSRCESFTSWNQNNKSNLERGVPNVISLEDNNKDFYNYEINKETNSTKMINNKNIENKSNNDVFTNTFYANNDAIPTKSSHENDITSNFHGAIPKMGYKGSTDSQIYNHTNYSRPILKSSPESSCTSPVDGSNFKKSWSTGHGVFGPKNAKSKSIKYTPSLLREFDPLSQKSNTINNDSLDINFKSFKLNKSNVAGKDDTVHQNQILDTQVKRSFKTEPSNLKPSFRHKSDDSEINGIVKTSSLEPQALQNKIEKLEPEPQNLNREILSASNESSSELPSPLHTSGTSEHHEKDVFKVGTLLSQDSVDDTNIPYKEKEIQANQKVLTSQNFPQDFLKPLELESSQVLQNSSGNSKSTFKGNIPNTFLSERTNLSEPGEIYSKTVVKNNDLHENVSEIKQLPDDFLRPENLNLKENNNRVDTSNDIVGTSNEETPKPEELSQYPIHRESSLSRQTQLEISDCKENVSNKETGNYYSRLSIKEKNGKTSGISVGQSEFFLEVKEETIPDLPSMAQWKEILFIDEIKMYFIKNESEINSPFYRPNLQVLEEITFGRNIMNPTMKLLVLSQKGPPHWTRDLSMENVKVFKTVAGAFIFSETDGTYVGIKFSVKTNFKKISKFMSLLASHTYFEKEFARKSSNSSKVSKLIDDLVGKPKADKIQGIAKDVTRHSMRTIKFAKNALGVAKDQQAQKSYQEPETESTFGSFVELQRMGKILEKNIIENNIKYY